MKIAIVGASGLVGRKMVETLNKSSHELVLYCSNKSAGQTLNGLKLIELNDKTLQKVDIALFSAGSTVSKLWAKKFTKLGAFVIDNSNAFRRETSVPLVVPEINPHTINNNTKIIANPNCSTIQIALPLFYLNKQAKIKKVIISTYQASSGAGKKGLLDLENGTAIKFPHPLTDNLIPQIDIALENGYTLEEDKMRFELKKILECNISVVSTAIRVPVKNCHGASVYVEFEKPLSKEEAKAILLKAKGITLQDNLERAIYPMPISANNTDQVYIGRLRQDLDNEKALSFWVVADNLRKGASTNAIQIMEIVKNFI